MMFESFDEPFSMIGLDLVGAFTADVLGYTHILVIRDFFDRVVELTAIKGKDSKAYLSGLLKYAATFGIPRYVRTDNGAEFTNNLVQEFNALLKISVILFPDGVYAVVNVWEIFNSALNSCTKLFVNSAPLSVRT